MEIVVSNLRKFVLSAVLLTSTLSAQAQGFKSTRTYNPIADPCQASEIPATFGPFKAQSTSIGVYKARLNLLPSDLNERLYVVVRTQSDKSHRFGWVRAFVNNQLVATEAELHGTGIVKNITKSLKAGEVQLSVMGAAYPGTCIDFYVVPENGVMKVLESPPLGGVVGLAGPFVTTGGSKQEAFSNDFSLSASENKGRALLSIRAENNNTHRFSFIRAFVNGTEVATESSFNGADATVDISDKTIAGKNKLDFVGISSPGTHLGWHVMQLPKFSKSASNSERGTGSGVSHARPPLINRLNPATEIVAGQTLQIQGEYFEPAAAGNKVLFDERSVDATSLKNKLLSVTVPQDIMSGTYNMSVAVNNQQSNAMPLTVKGRPRVLTVSEPQCQPGYELEIRGDNFPETLSQVRVSFGSISARVLQTCKHRILVTVPDLPEDTVCPIKVLVGQLPSNDNISVKIVSH